MTDTTYEVSAAMNKEKQEQQMLLNDYELRRKAKTVVVPTEDGRVRALLRQMGEPITLFGEKEMERRERLRRLLAAQEATTDQPMTDMPVLGEMIITQMAEVQTEKFYTEGTEELKQARLSIADWSLRRAAHRVGEAKRKLGDRAAKQEGWQVRRSALASAKALAQQSSEIGDERPISDCHFSPQGDQLATCGWGGALACWSVAGSCKRVWSVRAHDERCTGVAWHPAHVGPGGGGGGGGGGAAAMEVEGKGSGSSSVVALATASVDRTARLFTSSGKLIRKLEGHTDRLARLAFHPMGRHLGTASFDLTWRMWDVETGACLLEQEGHSRAVYAVAFHPDGSLAASAGLDAVGRLWDCRTGRSPFALEGHVKQILSVDFSPSGVQLATGSDDHTCKVWDLRQRRCMYTIPAHTSLVASCSYERGCGGAYLVTAGYDCLIKVWSTRDFSLVKTLAGHEGKVMGVDVCSRAGRDHVLASVSYDRTLKLWGPEQGADQGQDDVDMHAA